MAEKLEDLGIPVRPAAAPVQRPLPPRLGDVARPTSEPATSPDASLISPRPEPSEPRSMIVGPGIFLSGDIKSCNRLVVEGSLEATLHDCREMKIAEGGEFKGNASIEQAEIRGHLDGELAVSKRLLICATGYVSGTITYGQIEIERGGRVSGTMQEKDPVPNFGLVRAGE